MYETKTSIALHDTDAAGVTFFVSYFRIAHAAYEVFMTSIGWGLDKILSQGQLLILIARAEAEYQRPLLYGEAVTISIRAEKIDRTSFVLVFDFKGAGDKVAATVRTVHVAVDRSSGKKLPLPDELRAGLRTISQ